MRRSAVILCAVCALAACGPSRVSVTYPRPDTPRRRTLSRALGNLYVLIRKPETMKNTIANRTLKKAIRALLPFGETSFPVDSYHFASKLRRSIESRGGHILAYRVTRDAWRDDPYLRSLEPSGIMVVDFRSLRIKRTKTEKETKRKNKKGEMVTRKARYWKFEALMGLKVELVSEPGGEVLAEFPVFVKLTDQVTRRPKTEVTRAQWYKRSQKKLLARAAAKAAGKLGKIPSVRLQRALHKDKKDPVSKAALKAAFRDDWERASELWVERYAADKTRWRDVVNLAVAAEVRHEFAEAERLYKKAREAAGPDPEAKKVGWDKTLGELRQALDAVGTRSRASVAWFEAPLAVLPFSDATASVDGPMVLRELVQETLKESGYNTLPLDEVDTALRLQGYSQGGQLKGVRARKIAGWLEARRLIFGHVAHFEEITLGIYGRRRVAGRLRLYDHGKGKYTWSGDRPAVNEGPIARSGGEALGRLAGQLARGMFERIAGKPLGRECAQFARQNLETLPLRPSK